MVTEVPKTPTAGERLSISGVTVNVITLLACPPTVTTTGPVWVPGGTWTKILVSLQLDGVAATPLKMTVLLP